jgi:hypothetical protein
MAKKFVRRNRCCQADEAASRYAGSVANQSRRRRGRNNGNLARRRQGRLRGRAFEESKQVAVGREDQS